MVRLKYPRRFEPFVICILQAFVIQNIIIRHAKE